MIILYQNSTNKLTVTLKERTELDLDYYLLEVYNIDTREFTYKLFHRENDNLSPNTDRYDEFELVLPADMDLKLNQYHYFFYLLKDNDIEKALEDKTCLIQVEKGQLRVKELIEDCEYYND